MMTRSRSLINILAMIAYFAMPQAWAMEIEGRVIKVIDGNTIWVMSEGRNHKFKLQYIVAPEPSKDHGAKARSNLRSIINGKTVRVRWSEYDRYGGAAGQVFFRNEDINLRQVREGYARHDKERAKQSQDRHDFYFYDRAEEEATTARRGLWKDIETHQPQGAINTTTSGSRHRVLKDGEI